ncbi:DegT/DnrJ/EryC1/StrS aminotransferase family protein [Moraxella osloensis]|uniref:DegT/DnrJ/EryC1/StrS aminotransferase family protein n=1 Tax=Faucicola osloensis TaxID=34062 RepID=A0AAW6TFY4_FAUOS|nr:DegT/DnrJ/EryC1/StrS aminotransferase family protein [Moraxella osloensis]MDI4509535.1 DegT/DnrJ/EryC1/StrS aminotransferase family protein [Moraxella osloensis]
MLNTQFSPWPSFTQEEAEAVSRVLLSNQVNYWTGSETRNFEKEFAQWVGTKYAVALSNGTLALDVALQALDIGEGDEVIVTPRSFIASVSTVINAGAMPVFVDVEPDSGNISARTIAPHITNKTKAIICVHLAGWPCDMDAIMELAEQHNLWVIEDCAQAHGAKYKGKSVGSIGHIGAWSFCQDKIMTTGGEGGMVTTNDKTLWQKMWEFKDHGKNYDSVYHKQHPPGFRWLHDSFGTNWRMMEMQAVIGRIQLTRMAQWTRTRTQYANMLTKALLPFSSINGALRLPNSYFNTKLGADSVHAYYKYYVYLRPQNLPQGVTRDTILQALNTQSIPCFSGTCPEIYLEKAFDNHPSKPKERLPIAKQLGEESLMFLVHPSLTTEEMQQICNVIKQLFTSLLT